jgi:drug/metabolite transporter (DMT)-like permease
MLITYKQTLILLAYCFAMGFGQLLIKFAAVNIRVSDYSVHGILNLLMSPLFLIACSYYFALMVSWTVILANIPINIAYPFTSVVFLIVPLLNYLFFSEVISLQYVIGTIFILIGINFILRG